MEYSSDIVDKNALVNLLSLTDEGNMALLFARANAVKTQSIGNKVYLRGLIEFSNVCTKNCYYCGIRCANKNVIRYELTDEEVLSAVDFAWENRYGSVVLQSGEQQSARFTQRITTLLHSIKQHTNNEIGITLSCGEQSMDTYQEWFEAGAHRYLLRIETSDKTLYRKIHPDTPAHSFEKRLEAIYNLQKIGYQTGTGVMIGLPFQTIESLANDLLFFKKMNIDMVGMGPYLEHHETPLYVHRHLLFPPSVRFELTLKMIAALRLLMPDINIAATTALQVIDPLGREKAVQAGANVIMPNMTTVEVRSQYQIYENKPGIYDDAEISKSKLEANLQQAGIEIGYNEWGDSKHFKGIVKKSYMLF